MMRRGLKLMKKGREVWANFPLEGSRQYRYVHETFIARNAVILMDEASLLFPASAWNKIPFEVLQQWRQHRHDGVEIYMTCQHFSDLAGGLRRVVQFRNLVSSIRFSPNRPPFLIKWRTMDGRGKVKYGGGFCLFDPTLAEKYSTHFKVARQDYLGGGQD